MDDGAEHWPLPPRSRTDSGTMRRIGVELEMTGPPLSELARLVARWLGGRAEAVGRYEYKVSGDPAGDWGVELDVTFLKQWGRRDRPVHRGWPGLDEAAEDIVRLGVEQVMPMEVVSPPLPMDRLARVDDLIAELRAAGAKGTAGTVVHAFGLQLNPEMPATDADTITAYLKAFFCLFDWLKWRAKVDFSRRLTTFVDPFPVDYMRRVVDPGYWPDRDDLIRDYLAANPTRNRALDLLPLFAYLDARQVRAVVDDPRINPRPALHYRLPNSEIDRPGWGVWPAWRDWLQVEYLAAKRESLEAVCRDYAVFLDRPMHAVFGNWAKTVSTWLQPIGR